jgi:carbonic anhydrase/acetyltransferase-like protein (isoleucine patch superfamily)
VDVQRRDGFVAGSLDGGLTILGNDLLERTATMLSSAGVKRPTVVYEALPLNRLPVDCSSKVTSSSSVWEQALSQSVQSGVDVLLVIGAAAYTELDYSELVRFHLERRAAMTQVYADGAPLDIVVIDTAQLRDTGGACIRKIGALRAECEQFNYPGYANRLRGPEDFMQLVEDALYRRCELRPAATEIANGLWIANGAEVDDSCVIGAPSFIGDYSRIAACCNISGGSAIESACHVDSGTIIERSWILSNPYIGIGLNVRRSIVSKRKMFHLDRKTEITTTDRRLFGSTRSLPLLPAERRRGRGTSVSN